MAMKGLAKKGTTEVTVVHPIVGLRICKSNKNAKGLEIYMLNLMVPALTPGKSVFMHAIPINTTKPDSEFFSLFAEVTGGSPRGLTMREAAVKLAGVVIEKEIGLSYKLIKSPENQRFLQMTHIRSVSMTGSHPGAMEWPEKSKEGEDLLVEREVEV